jgi:hypothetical protein
MVVSVDSMPPASGSAAEIAALMLNPGWGVLQDALVAEKIAPSWRHILSHHTSQCCRPAHKGGVVPSLKSAGLDTVIQCRLGLFIVVLELPALFNCELFNCELVASDFLGHFKYASREHDTHEKAQEEACLTCVTFLLTIAPQRVFIAQNSMRDIDRVRAAAEEFRQTVPPASGTWLAWYIHLHNAPQPGQTVAKALKMGYIEPRNEAERAQRVLNVIDVLRTWLGTQTPADPCKCPIAIREQLMTLVARKQLKTFLLRHQCAFIVNEAPDRTWTFSLAAVAEVSRNDVAPLVAAAPAEPPWAERLKDGRCLDAKQCARRRDVVPDSVPARVPTVLRPPATDQRGTSGWVTYPQSWSSSEQQWSLPPATDQRGTSWSHTQSWSGSTPLGSNSSHSWR